MDRLSKVLLAVIAVSLAAIAARLWQPGEAHAQGGFLYSAPTIGEFQDTKDPEARRKLVRRIPLVRVQGGLVSVD